MINVRNMNSGDRDEVISIHFMRPSEEPQVFGSVKVEKAK